MRTETTTRTLYTFDELSETAKEKALEVYRDINLNFDWWDGTYEDAKNIGLKIDDIFTLQKDDPPIQFLELDVYKLEENGLCIIVLPYGEFFSGSFKSTRKHFLETVNITDIIIVPSVFTHTAIRTCILIFEKNREGTKEIKFSRINEDCNKLV
jgi:type I restriction-modification system DNA methylase subunit